MGFSIRTNVERTQFMVTDALPVGQWVHVALTLSGNTGILYVNGAPKVAAYITLNPSDVMASSQQNNYIGKSQSATDPLYNGQIDDFRIYDYALSATEIADLAASGAVAPEILAAPVTRSIEAGGSVTQSAQAIGTPEPSYQWQLDGIDIPGATGSDYELPSVQAFHAGGYTVVARNAGGSVTSAPASLTVQLSAPSDARLLNLSTRAQSLTGDNTLIPGFVIGGVGPTLAIFGVSGTLADPVLTIYNGSNPILSNDDWEIGADAAATASASVAVGAFDLASGSKDSAFVVTLPPGAYTIQATGKEGATGVALVEVYLVL